MGGIITIKVWKKVMVFTIIGLFIGVFTAMNISSLKTVEDFNSNNEPPYPPTDPIPEDGEENVGLRITLSVYVSDPDGDTMDVYFYNADTGKLLGIDKKVQNDSTSSYSLTLPFNTTFAWFTFADDGEYQKRGPSIGSWSFNTKSDNYSFYDYTDDVFCLYIETIDLNNYRTDEKQNVNIISGSYSRNNDNVTLKLEVEGIIEDRGNFIYSNESEISVNSVFYGFNLKTSKNNYIIDYCNGSCVLKYDNIIQNLSYFLVDGSKLSITFSLNNTSETFNSIEIMASDFYIDIDTFKFEINIDFATNIEYSMDIEILKPENSLYVFNRKILPLSLPIAVGKIDIEIEELLNETFIFHSELYIDSELTKTPSFPPNILSWNKLSFGKHTLKVIAFDLYGNRASDEMIVWKFF